MSIARTYNHEICLASKPARGSSSSTPIAGAGRTGGEEASPRGGSSTTHPSTSSRFRGIRRGSPRPKRQHSQKASSTNPILSANDSLSAVAIANNRQLQQRGPKDVGRRVSDLRSATKDPNWISQPWGHMVEDLGTAYYAHKKPPWSDVNTVGFQPISWARPVSSVTAKKNSYVTPPAAAAAAGKNLLNDSPYTVWKGTASGSSSSTRLADKKRARANYSHRKHSGTYVPEALTSKLSTMSMGPRNIMIGFDDGSSGQDDGSRWTPPTPINASPDFAAPIIAGLESLAGVRNYDTPSAVSYVNVPLSLLPSTVYRRESTKPLVLPRSATVPPELTHQCPPTLGASTTTQLSSDTEGEGLDIDSVWEDDTPESADVPHLTPHTCTSSSPETPRFSMPSHSVDKPLPDTPGLGCPGCLIGGKRPQLSSRDAPREEHKGSLRYPEERESGFCNACRQGDLLPEISRFTLLVPDHSMLVRDEPEDAEDGVGSRHEPRIVANEIEVGQDRSGHIIPHALDSKFTLGATEESDLGSRRRLDIATGMLRLSSAPPERETSTKHIAECKLPFLPSRSLDSPGIISNTVSEINSALGDWEADIFKDYGAMTPVDVSTATFPPLRPLKASPRLKLTEEANARLMRRLDIPTARLIDPGEETPRTQMYNIHKRANGDF